MLRRLLSGSLRRRKSRLLLAVLAMFLGASLVSALVTLSLGIGQKAGKELRRYGANILLLPQGASLASSLGLEGETGGYLMESSLEGLDSVAREGEEILWAPLFYTLGKGQGETVVVAGADLTRLKALNPGWRWEGGLPREGQAVLGRAVAQRWDLDPGETFSLSLGGESRLIRVSGVVEAGASEDNQVLLPLGEAQAMAGAQGRVSLVLVSALTRRPLPLLAQELEARVPGAEARVLAQVATSEQRVLGRVQLLLGLVTALVLLVSALAVFSTLSSTVLERTKEIGLMKALGAEEREIGLLFGLEALVIGLAGGLGGYLTGLLLAQGVGRGVFGSGPAFQPLALPVTLAVSLLVALGGGVLPIRRATAVDPAQTLRGE